jgi:hypothetical protein
MGEAVIDEQRAAAGADRDRDAADTILADEDGDELFGDQALDVGVVHGAGPDGGTGDQRGGEDRQGKPHD